MSDVYDELRIPLVARIAGVVEIMASLTILAVGLQAGLYGGFGILFALLAVVSGLLAFVFGGMVTQGRGIAAVMGVLLDLAVIFGLVAWFAVAFFYYGTLTVLPIFSLGFVGFAALLVAIATPGSLALDKARRALLAG